jgi:DNA-binding response OmpR family regulator
MSEGHRTRSILIVEDHEDAAEALKILFESRGYAVVVAGSVAAACEAASSCTPDLALIDLTLPDGTGFDILERLRGTAGEPRMSVALTGLDRAEIAERCFELGCHDVMMKPVGPRALLAKLDEWL